MDSNKVDSYRALESHPWMSDDEFQSGLRAILGQSSSSSHMSTSENKPLTEQQHRDITLRARCFFWNRQHPSEPDISYEEYKQWRDEQDASVLTPLDVVSADKQPAQNEAPPQASFAEIMQMIKDGTPIPGIKDIPDTVLEGHGTEASRASRKKPWEKA